ncbi:MAG TPA: murein biosynthesis integral membrane protein MurJ [Patescibacteria group bacterium]|nr:murein biosynthesis integral membrane protein MurJ [Patescibacteria group bacterium]
MLKKIFSKSTKTISSAAILVAFFSVLSRFLGIIRDKILASEFGAGATLDAYFAAFRVPDLLFNLIVLGALSAGFIPVFTKYIKDFSVSGKESREKNKEAWLLSTYVLNLLMISLVAVSILGMIFANYLVDALVPGFGPEQRDLTVTLTRVMFLSPIFLGISSVLSGVLQSYKRFFAYSLAPILYNLGIILGAVYFSKVLGPVGLAWGVILGAFLHMVIQVPSALISGFTWQLKVDFKNSGLRKILKMMVPRTLTLAISQINLLVVTIISSSLIVGSLAVFNFANNLQSFPLGVFGVSFAIAAFPTLSRLSGQTEKIKKVFNKTFKQILFFIIPSTVLLITLRAQIIRVILGAGKFDWQDTVLTIDTLGFFALSLFAQATLPLMVRMFYAYHDSRTPFFMGLISVIVNVFLSFYLAGIMGVAGLALSFSISMILNFFLLWISLRIKLGSFKEMNILISILKFSIAAILAGLAVQIAKIIIWTFVDMTTFWGVFTQGLGAGILGIIVYLVIVYLLKVEEINILLKRSHKRLKKQDLEIGNTDQNQQF